MPTVLLKAIPPIFAPPPVCTVVCPDSQLFVCPLCLGSSAKGGGHHFFRGKQFRRLRHPPESVFPNPSPTPPRITVPTPVVFLCTLCNLCTPSNKHPYPTKWGGGSETVLAEMQVKVADPGVEMQYRLLGVTLSKQTIEYPTATGAIKG